MNYIAVITGPTASGKTKAAIEIAKKINGEIISCDSMQIYKGMNIGTAKPTQEELLEVRHHMIDILNPCENFSCADYQKMAYNTADEIISRGKIPVFCGGTGLYIDAVVSGNIFSETGSDHKYREELEKYSCDELHSMLYKVDYESALAIHKNNKKRVIRALEIFKTTGVTKTEWDKKSKPQNTKYNFDVISLNYTDRDALYERINRRVDIMIENGLLEEVKILNLKRDSNAAQAIGYRELYSYLDGLWSFEEAVENIKTATRNYAKRQITWFKYRDYIKNIDISNNHTFEEIVNNVQKLLTFDNNCDIIHCFNK